MLIITDLKHTLVTFRYCITDTVHRGNIFCVNFQPNNENVVLSCAGDGVLCYNDVNNPKFGSKSLMSTNLLMHMFAFDLDQPHVVYTAEEAGPSNAVNTFVVHSYLII